MENTVSGRYIVGIDLGTTNCSMCYIDREETSAPIRVFEVPQLVAAGETGAEALLPSFTYLPGEHELPEGALDLPWRKGGARAVGRFAREQGARIPERMVSSAKSWLAHGGVDRSRPILPWGGELGRQMVSPVQVSAFYLEHLRDAWNSRFGRKRDHDGSPCILEEQQIVLTVPASFDEVARELTLKAAHLAGFRHLTLIEEPLAAFYAWLARHSGDWRELVTPGDVIAVVDVGGGTTDFSLIELDEGGALRRKAVGNHLLLGGDNMDMAMAHIVESAWKIRLNQRQWTMLCQECRHAKEALLSVDGGSEAEEATYALHLAGTGSSVVASSRSYVFTRRQVMELLMGQFFGDIPLDAPSPELRKGLQQMGLPYAADPMVTRHLLEFLRRAGKSLSVPASFARPTKILFNGGAMIPSVLRAHVCGIVSRWTGQAVDELSSEDFSLAVARGAAHYGRVREGGAMRVKGGIANAYFLEIEAEGRPQLLCVMARDTDEGVVCRQTRVFRLQANARVSFPLYASATRLGDQAGELIDVDAEDVTALAPLQTLLKYGRRGEAAELEVSIASRLNEIGTLEVWCEALHSEHRFPLTFELRESSELQEASDGRALSGSGALPSSCVVVEESRTQEALASIGAVFGDESGGQLDGLTKRLEGILDMPRLEWPVTLLRRFADELLSNVQWRDVSARHESRWENLLGFCGRPGFGVSGDSERIRRAWMLWHRGVVHAASADVQVNWCVLWRRLAAGLSSGQQSQMSGALFRELVSREMKTVIRRDDLLAVEKWRLTATLEKVPVSFKLKCLGALVKGTGRLDDAGYWPIARLASRRLFAGSADAIVPAAKLEGLLPLLLQKSAQSNAPVTSLLALANAVRLTGERTLDVSASLRADVLSFLTAHGAPGWMTAPAEALQAETASEWHPEFLGDSLPLGLRLA